jgi:hypothetical protein
MVTVMVIGMIIFGVAKPIQTLIIKIITLPILSLVVGEAAMAIMVSVFI